VVASVLFFKLTVPGRNFYWQIQLQSFHTAWAIRVDAIRALLRPHVRCSPKATVSHQNASRR
jgi:hypothetical protein